MIDEAKFNAVVAAWFDEKRTAVTVARDVGVPQWRVYEFWKLGKRRGLIPDRVRSTEAVRFGGGNRTAQGQRGLPPDAEPWAGYDVPLTVGRDLLLRRLQECHGDDPARADDDMTAQLDGVAQRMSRGVRPGEYAA